MTISADGWFDWAVRDPGPDSRWAAFNHARTPMDTIVHHSFEGWYNSIAGDGYNVMEDPTRNPTGWHGTICTRNITHKGKTYPPGTLFQHYPVFARLQHANAANITGPGFELEGVANMLITPEQIVTWKRIHADMRAFTGKPYLRRLTGSSSLVGLLEHREVPGSQTGCPSNRYLPLWASIAADAAKAIEEANKGDDGMNKEEKEAFDTLSATVKEQAELINQLQTQLWGEGSGRRTNSQPYAATTMHTLDDIAEMLPKLARITVLNGPNIGGDELIAAINEHDREGHCLWQWVNGINDAVEELKGLLPG